MKKIFTIISALTLLGVGASAQIDASQLRVTARPMPVSFQWETNMDKAPFDTLDRPLRNGCSADSVFFYSGPQGYLTGTNGTFGTQELAQRFMNNTSGAVVGAAGFWEVHTGSGTYAAKIYSETSNAPGAVTGTSAAGTFLPQQQMIVWNFATPAPITGNFFLSSPVTGAAGDSIVYFSSRNGCGNGDSYLKVTAGWTSFKTISNNQFDVDLQYVVVIDRAGAGIEEANLPSSSLMPNPAYDNATLVYHLKENAKVNITVTSLTGQVVKVVNEGSKQAGTYVASIDVTDLAAGTYIYSLSANGKNTTGRLVVAK